MLDFLEIIHFIQFAVSWNLQKLDDNKLIVFKPFSTGSGYADLHPIQGTVRFLLDMKTNVDFWATSLYPIYSCF